MGQGQLVRILVICLLLVGLGGCSRMVAQNLSQKQAMEAVVVLGRHGIVAVPARQRGGQSQYEVSVKERDYSRAAGILVEYELLNPARLTLDETLEDRGFLPEPREIAALRRDRALALDLEESLLQHPMIASARVIVRNQVARQERPAVAVVIQAVDLSNLRRSELLDLICSAVPGALPDDISLMIEAAPLKQVATVVQGIVVQGSETMSLPLVPLLFWYVPAGADFEIILTLSVLLVLAGVVGMAGGYVLSMYRQARQFGTNSYDRSQDGELSYEQSTGLPEK